MVERKGILEGKSSCTYRRIGYHIWEFIRQIELVFIVLIEPVIIDNCSRRNRLLQVRLLLRNPA
jgi:hypothetical protein